jgi:hypothetical protein
MGKGDRSPTSRAIVPPVRCTAHSSRTGEQCQAWAIVGHHVCITHGGAAPQVREAARRRFLLLVDDAVYGVEKLAGVGGHGLAAKDERVQLAALRDILDRAGLKPTDRLELIEEPVTNESLDAALARALEKRDETHDA